MSAIPQERRIPVRLNGNGTVADYLDELNDAAKKEWLDEQIKVVLAWWYQAWGGDPSDEVCAAFCHLDEYLRQDAEA